MPLPAGPCHTLATRRDESAGLAAAWERLPEGVRREFQRAILRADAALVERARRAAEAPAVAAGGGLDGRAGGGQDVA
ncbi:MAG: hypothetical protein NTX87_02400 [Planctomycetota bacterium]|nr:hypothetical protein [Planctomycetota bacterium]